MTTGTVLIWVGVGVVLVGILVTWAPWAFSWFGNLPGDIRHRSEHSTVFIPITSMIIVSIGISVLLALIRRLGE